MATKKYILVICLSLVGLFCQAQHFVLTQSGLVSSQNPSQTYIEYAYRDCNYEQLKSFLDERFKGVKFFNYSVSYINDRTIQVRGYMDSNSFLVLGTKELAFRIQLELGETSVKVDAKLTKYNGKPLNYNLLFAKSGKVRFAPVKNKIEDDIRVLIEQIFETKVVNAQ